MNVAIGVGSAGGAPRGAALAPAAATSSRRSSPTARAACPVDRVVTVVGKPRSRSAASGFGAALGCAFFDVCFDVTFAATLAAFAAGFAAGRAFSFTAGLAAGCTAGFGARPDAGRARGGCRLLRDPLEATCALGAGCLPEP